MRNTLLSLLSLFPALVFCQITFFDASGRLELDAIRSGAPMGVVDMNGDGLDDIVRLDLRQLLYISYQLPDTAAFDARFIADMGDIMWSLCVADPDQNGYNDVFTGGNFTGLNLAKASNDGSAFTVDLVDGPPIFLQGSNFSDINNDGAVDIFACHDLGLSVPFRNNGQGSFTADFNLIMTASTVPSDNSGNYGSVWTDYDNDGDIDLYISKCREGVDDPTDGRRLNLLFQNDGENNYTEVASLANIQPFGQSWAADFGDIDNDGDMDCFVINHDINNVLYENDGDGTFTDVTVPAGLIAAFVGTGAGLQCKFADFDNDGFVDLLYTAISAGHAMLRNNGDGTFTRISNPFPIGSMNLHSAAVGDLNADGFLDVYGGFGQGYNQLSNQADRLFLNNGNGNHYFKVALKGLAANVNGIGARVELYGSWGKQIREVRSGESYGIMNSFTAHFGLGDAQIIDSLVVRWPNGNVDLLPNPPIDTMLMLQEGDYCLPQSSFSMQSTALTVTFTGQGDVGISDWSWDFGDGSVDTGQVVTHTFPAEGLYTICLSSTGACGPSQFCKDVFVECVVPQSMFFYGSDGLDISYEDQSPGNPTSWLWEFGDGNISTEPNPDYGYSSPGTYIVCLTVGNECGNTAVCQFVQVACGGVTTAFDYEADGLSVQFEDFSSAGTNTWMWDFGDGTSSSEQNPLHEFPATGEYEVCLTVDGVCGPGEEFCTTLQLSCPPPDVNFFAFNDELTVTFQDSSANTPTGWLWDFGDGNTSMAQHPVHNYSAPGEYEVCLTASSPCGASQEECRLFNFTCTAPQAGFAVATNDLNATFTDTSTFNPSEWVWTIEGVDTIGGPVLEIAFDNEGTYEICLTASSVCGASTICQSVQASCATPQAGFSFQADGLGLSLMDTSAVPATEWLWDFGDGNTAVEQNPEHSYASPGDYLLCLTIRNGCGDTSQLCQPIAVSCAAPEAGFGFATDLLTASFTDTSPGSPDQWAWDFGDGNASAQQNPEHTYSAPGDYQVCLTATSICGVNTLCQTVEIICVEPQAGFTIQEDELTISLTDTSQNLPSQWLWNFGDGNTSAQQNPEHTYDAPGSYLVCLLATSICGNNQLCQMVTVSCPAPEANFTFQADELSLSFSSQAINGPTNWQWDFGDGAMSTVQNPAHTYTAPGSYQVCLTAGSVCGSDQFCTTVPVSCAAPQAGFTFQADELSLSFSDNSTANPTQWLWDFGDGNSSTASNPQHTYALPGNYQVCLQVSSVCGTDTRCQAVEVSCPAPQADFSFQISQLTAGFADQSGPSASEWLWDFGDGSFSTDPNPQHTYTSSGTYTVCLSVSSICGNAQSCQDVTVFCPAPVADFSFAANQLAVSFADQSDNGPTSWFWEFGDGDTSTLANPQHTYQAPGTYQVCLSSTSACGTGQDCQQVSVTCNAPQANFEIDAQELRLSFTDLSTNGPTSWLWTFGDGNSSIAQNPEHTFSFPGSYLVCLFVSSTCGNTQRCELIEVNCAPPQAGFVYTADDLVVAFQDNSEAGVAAWLWDFGDGSGSTKANPQHTFAAPGTYDVCLTVSNICGNTESCTSVTVSCPAPAAAFSFSQDGLTLSFESLAANGPEEWLWDFGDGNSSTESNPQHTYDTTGLYQVCLTASSRCGTDSACQEVLLLSTGTGWPGSPAFRLSLYPNPASDGFYVRIDGSPNPAFEWTLFNALGQAAGRGHASGQQTEWISLEHQTPGLYWLHVRMEEQQWVKPVAKQ